IGVNGHIGFNEPADTLFENTHKTALTESTMQANARFFTKDEVMPNAALTMGMASIFKARKIILLASGAGKREIIARLMSEDELRRQMAANCREAVKRYDLENVGKRWEQLLTRLTER
ncbi:MAG: 6-phosphogluconolactonase, partial [Rikenellaceae bacterium]|nr:6-phosphogluconolactonase [Rikenellaceae bacterium]